MITPVNFIQESPAGVGVGRYGDFIHTFTGGLAYSIIQMFFFVHFKATSHYPFGLLLSCISGYNIPVRKPIK